MAAAQALQRQPAALQGPVFADCLVSVDRAGRVIPALGWRQGGNMSLIETNEGEEQFFHEITKNFLL